MRVYSKTIKVLALTPDEMSQLTDMIKEASSGTVVHYSERQQANGQYFGISVDKSNETPIRPLPGDMREPFPDRYNTKR